jgi:hypothetical protein
MSRVATGKIVVPCMSTFQVFIRSTFNFERGLKFQSQLAISPRKGQWRSVVRFPFDSRAGGWLAKSGNSRMVPPAFSIFERSPSIDRQSCRHQHIVGKRRMIGRLSQTGPRHLATTEWVTRGIGPASCRSEVGNSLSVTQKTEPRHHTWVCRDENCTRSGCTPVPGLRWAERGPRLECSGNLLIFGMRDVAGNFQKA